MKNFLTLAALAVAVGIAVAVSRDEDTPLEEKVIVVDTEENVVEKAEGTIPKDKPIPIVSDDEQEVYAGGLQVIEGITSEDAAFYDEKAKKLIGRSIYDDSFGKTLANRYEANRDFFDSRLDQYIPELSDLLQIADLEYVTLLSQYGDSMEQMKLEDRFKFLDSFDYLMMAAKIDNHASSLQLHFEITLFGMGFYLENTAE